MEQYRYRLRVADLGIEIQIDHPLRIEPRFRPFLTEEIQPDVTVCFHRTEALPPIPEAVLYEDRCYRIHPDGKGGYLRSFFDAPRDMTAYALAAYAHPAGQIRVDYLEKGRCCLSEMTNTFFHLAFEALLIHKNRLCIHAACVETRFGGILFSGPSGIGKSTQAELWCRYRGAKLLNGDRPVLAAAENGWLAWGSPFAGSSRCHLNENTSVRAIVMVRRGEDSCARRLPEAEAFRAVWAQLTVPLWDEKTAAIACNLAMELVSRIPVYELTCRPDSTAVEALEHIL